MVDQAGPADTTTPIAATEPSAPITALDPYSTVAGEGDTLETCAARLGVTADELFDLNRGVIGSDPANVRFGMRLVIPAPAPAATPAPAQEG
ncbi:MAG: LysM peptidoglycan-binding domain-containing protein [Myxococcales bacterium]